MTEMYTELTKILKNISLVTNLLILSFCMSAQLSEGQGTICYFVFFPRQIGSGMVTLLVSLGFRCLYLLSLLTSPIWILSRGMLSNFYEGTG